MIDVLKDIDKSIEKADNEMASNDDMQKDIILEIGAPWNWIYQFVAHNSPQLKSYNFIEAEEIKKEEEASVSSNVDEKTEEDAFLGVVPKMDGVGSTISKEVVTEFLDYLKSRSTKENGLIFPQMFQETDCPPMM